jgi:hypothetical protein
MILSINHNRKSTVFICRRCNSDYLHYYKYDKEVFDALGLSYQTVQYFTACPYCDNVERLRIYTDSNDGVHQVEYL